MYHYYYQIEMCALPSKKKAVKYNAMYKYFFHDLPEHEGQTWAARYSVLIDKCNCGFHSYARFSIAPITMVSKHLLLLLHTLVYGVLKRIN